MPILPPSSFNSGVNSATAAKYISNTSRGPVVSNATTEDTQPSPPASNTATTRQDIAMLGKAIEQNILQKRIPSQEEVTTQKIIKQQEITKALEKFVADGTPFPYSREQIGAFGEKIGARANGEVYRLGDRVIKLLRPEADEGEAPAIAVPMWNTIYGGTQHAPGIYEGKFKDLATAKILTIQNDEMPEKKEEVFTAPFIKADPSTGCADYKAITARGAEALNKINLKMYDDHVVDNFMMFRGHPIPVDMGDIYPL